MKNWSLSQKVLAAGLLPTAICAFGLAFVYGALRDNFETNLWVSHTNEVLAEANGLMGAALAAQSGERGYVIAADESFLAGFDQASADFTERAARLRALLADNEAQLHRLANVQAAFNTWLRVVAQPVVAARRAHPQGVAEEASLKAIKDGTSQTLLDRFVKHFEDFERVERVLLKDRKRRSEQRKAQARAMALFAAGFAVLAAVGVAGGLSRSIRRSLTSLRDAADAVAGGDLDARAVVTGQDMVASVASRFNEMAQRLAAREHDAQLISRLTEMLIASHDSIEAAGIISSMLEQIFPNTAGGLYVADASKAWMEPIASWNLHNDIVRPFDVSACWALRRGRAHSGQDNPGALGCQHVEPQVKDYVCVPLVAHGEALSIVHMRPLGDGFGLTGQRQHLLDLAQTVAEQIAMALSNLQLRERLRAQSVRDPLTGLFNRRYLQETFERELSRAKRENRSVGLAVLDVDHFKRFNDSFGHQAGDVVLREVAQALIKGLRKEDVACRFGGEEMVLVLPGASSEDTRLRADALRMSIRDLQVSFEGQMLGRVTASFGVVAFPLHGATVETLMSQADAALYTAKNVGRDQVCVAPSPA